ncbi:MAG: single-stranded DNA-binding protein [Kouleothrix sp.]|nr:single-stranded DNA-binding protein [Kouleothrix sp.]
MARDLNKVQMTGRLGADPEMRYTPQGHAVTTFRAASNRSWRTSEGESHEDTEWFRVVAWNRLAEICNQWLAKGSRVFVEGRMQTRQWQDQEGQTRYLTEVIASDVIILDGRREGQPASQGDDAARAEPEPAAPDQPRDSAPAERPAAKAPAPRARASAPAARAAKVATLPRGTTTFGEEDLPF